MTGYVPLHDSAGTARYSAAQRSSLRQKQGNATTSTLSLGVKRPNELQRNQILLGISFPLPVFDRNQGNVLEAIQREEKARDKARGSQYRSRPK